VTIRVALVGGGFIAKAHAAALHALPVYFPDAPRLVPRLVCDVTEELARAAAARLGFEESAVGWEAAASRDDIDLVIVATPPDLHREIAVAAARAGKHVLCEKPLARNAAEAEEMCRAAEDAGVAAIVGFNLRQAPALQQALRMIADGSLGEVVHVTGRYFQDHGCDPARPLTWRYEADRAGSGALGDLGSHLLDLARECAGEIAEVTASARTVVPIRPAGSGQAGRVTVEDCAALLVRFASGATGVFEVSRVAPGRKNQLALEIHGQRGTLAFDWERNNELRWFSANDPNDRQGFRTLLAGPAHPSFAAPLPVPGIGVGFLETMVVQAAKVGRLVAGDRDAGASLALFHDGLQNCRVLDAALASSSSRTWVEVPP
jgi:predicted dehydrogenase